jgi:hypothetical protein
VTVRYGVLSLLALFMIVLLALKNYETWTVPLDATAEKAVPKRLAIKPDGPQAKVDQKDPKATPSIASYIAIAEKNPFHPDRKEFPVFTQLQTPQVKPPPVRPQVTLYGVTIVGDYSSASISYPGRPLQKGEREVLTVKVGDRVGEYKLAKILEDRIGLETPEDSFEVFLYDAKAPKRRVYAKTENKPAAVTSTVPGPPEPSKPGGPAPASGQEPAGTPVQPGITQAPLPRPVTPAPIPSTRTRRWGPAPATQEPLAVGPVQ